MKVPVFNQNCAKTQTDCIIITVVVVIIIFIAIMSRNCERKTKK